MNTTCLERTLPSFRSRAERRLLAVMLAGSISSAPLIAQTIVIETRSGGQNLHMYSHSGALGTAGEDWYPSTGKSSAPGLTSGIGSMFAMSPQSSAVLHPVFPAAGGLYTMEVTIPITSSTPCDVMVDIVVEGGSGLPAATDAFAACATAEQSVWRMVGTLLLDPGITQPTITLTYTEGQGTPSLSRRWFMDAVRFVEVGNPCLDIPETGTVHGPLAAGQTHVDVPNISAAATAVAVYADGVRIGQLASGIQEGINRVPTEALLKDQRIAATQTLNGVEGCVPPTGPKVGGGANPSVRVNLMLRHNPMLEGPVGADGGTDGAVYILGSFSSVDSGYLNAPAEGAVLSPGTCWQTVLFQHAWHPEYPMTFQTAAPGMFAVFEGIAFALEEEDTGPYRIYIDSIVNGTTVIEDFEFAEPGSEDHLFRRPGFATTTRPLLVPAPDVSVVSEENADVGTRSALVSWQFRDTALPSTWLTLTTRALAGTPNPQIDLSQAISVRLLVLPLGETEAALRLGRMAGQTKPEGSSVTFSVDVFGEGGDLGYQWRKDGWEIFGANDATLTIENISDFDAGVYSVTVTDGMCHAEAFATLAIGEEPPSEISAVLSNGEVTLSWQGTAILQAAHSVDGPWEDIVGAASPYPVNTAAARMQFFRLRATQ